MGKSSASLRGIIYKSIYKYAETEDYERALALGLEEFSYTFEDACMDDYGVISVDVVLIKGTSIWNFDINSLRFSCTTQIFEGSKEVLNLSSLTYDYDIMISVDEIVEMHKIKGIYIDDSIYNVNFNVNLSGIKVMLMSPIRLAKVSNDWVRNMVKCGLADRMLNVVLDLDDWHSYIDNLKYLYYTCKGDLTLYVNMDRLELRSLKETCMILCELDGSLKAPKKFFVIISVSPSKNDEVNIYDKGLIEDMTEVYKIVDNIKLSYHSGLYVSTA